MKTKSILVLIVLAVLTIALLKANFPENFGTTEDNSHVELISSNIVSINGFKALELGSSKYSNGYSYIRVDNKLIPFNTNEISFNEKCSSGIIVLSVGHNQYKNGYVIKEDINGNYTSCKTRN